MKKKNRRKRSPKFQRRELRLEELKGILDRAKAVLSQEDHDKLEAAVETLAFLTRELEAKGTSLTRLRRLLFGPSTEKTSQVVGETSGQTGSAAGAAEQGPGPGGGDTDKRAKKKRKGHGRNGASAYRGADRVKVAHESLQRSDPCPECPKGKLYPQSEPATLVRVRGMAPLQATVYELQRLRCNLCGEVSTARAPKGVGNVKYDETAASMIGLLKYGSGLPFNRLERLERGLGIPLPAATQWEVVLRAEGLLAPAYGELVRQAAQGQVLYNDDTTMKILDLTKERLQQAASNDEAHQRTGVFTSGIVSTTEGHTIALFFTGGKHAGENLRDVLAQRAGELPVPIQMCDALPVNTAPEFDTILANCIAHARRRFVDVADNFPDECRHVLETLREIYKNDASARQRNMSPSQRLLFHKAESGPLMKGLKEWLQEQLEEHKVEPNSGLGEAIGYTLRHWEKLTLFLRKPGAPLDNNICERALKKAILHRKNSLFYKTRNGARVGDTFMSLIHTSELCGVDPFDYLVQLQRHHRELSQSPGDWMPWNYQETLANFSARAGPEQ